MKDKAKIKKKALKKVISKFSEEYDLVTMDGFDNCLVGVVERFGQNAIACYDKAKVLKKLEKEGMSANEAEEFFYFNQLGSWVGENTPCFLNK